MQFCNCFVQFGGAAVVVHDVGGVGQTRGPVSLRLQDACDLRRVQAVPCGHPGALYIFRDVDQEHAVDKGLLAGLEQQRDHEYDVGCRRSCGTFEHRFADLRVQDIFELPTRLRVSENPLAQANAVEVPGAVEHRWPESGDDLGECRLSRFDQCAAQQVGIYDVCAQACELVAGGGLAAAYATGQSDRQQVQARPASCR